VRGQAWRLAAAVVVSATAWAAVLAEQEPLHRWLDLALGLVAYGLVLLRRRHPLPVAVATACLAAASSVAAGASLLALVSLATLRRRGWIVVAGVLTVVSGEVWISWNPSAQLDPRWLSIPVDAVFVAASIGWGMYVGSRRELLWTLEQRAEAAEAERDLRVGRARGEERTRIAREMHDVLAHRITQIAVQAGALGYRDEVDAAEVRAGAERIRVSAHDALVDLREVLGVLRGSETEHSRSPQPSYDDLTDLVADARDSGMRVEFVDRLARDGGVPVPAGTGRTAYRLVQEGLTNARKHAPGAELRVEVAGAPGEGLTVEMRNDVGFERSATPGAGLGLVGLAERVELGGGTLEHGQLEGEFVLRAWLPWPC
jgi:signal transduction histidine kinase